MSDIQNKENGHGFGLSNFDRPNFKGLDEAAKKALFENAIKNISPVLLRTCNHIVNGYPSVINREAEAENLLQESLLLAFRHCGNYSGDDANFSTWITAIIRNQAITMFHRRMIAHRDRDFRNLVPIDPSDGHHFQATASPGYEQQIDNKRAVAMVRKLIGQIPDEMHRKIMVMRLSGYSVEEIVNALEVPEGTVKSATHREIKKIQRALWPRG